MSRPTGPSAGEDNPSSPAGRTPRGRWSTNSVNISGGTFSGSVVGAGEIHVGSVGGGDNPPTLAQLRDHLTAVRHLLIEAGATEEARAALAYELREILATLHEPRPDPAPVRTRWTAVQKLLGGIATAGTAVGTATKQITDLIAAVFGS